MTTEINHEALSNVTPAPPSLTAKDFSPVEMPEDILSLTESDILVDETLNVRRFRPDAKAIKEMAEDILNRGQLYPIIVREKGNKYVIVDGFSRYEAIHHLNEGFTTSKKLPIKAILMSMSDAEAFLAGASSNIIRNGMSPIDNARVIDVLHREYGMKKIDIAKSLRKSPAWVTEVGRMGELRAGVQKKIHTGEIGYSTARELLDMTDEDQDEYIAELEKEKAAAGTGKGTKKTKNSRDKLREKKRKKAQGESEGEGEGGGGAVSLSAKEMKKAYEELAGIGLEEGKECKYSGLVQAAGKLLLKHMAGKIGIKALASQLDKLPS